MKVVCKECGHEDIVQTRALSQEFCSTCYAQGSLEEIIDSKQ